MSSGASWRVRGPCLAPEPNYNDVSNGEIMRTLHAMRSEVNRSIEALREEMNRRFAEHRGVNPEVFDEYRLRAGERMGVAEDSISDIKRRGQDNFRLVMASLFFPVLLGLFFLIIQSKGG